MTLAWSAFASRTASTGFIREIIPDAPTTASVHPPEPGVVSRRRALRDADALCDVLARCGAELVLHGHLHRTRVGTLPGPAAPIPVVGVRSASHAGGSPGRVARYHLYDVEPETRRITLRAREYRADAGAFDHAEEHALPA